MKATFTPIGAFEAKTKFSELLDRVSKGASFTITKHDRPVARLVGFDEDAAQRRQIATATLRELRKRYTLGGLSTKELREEGRA